MNKLKLEKEGKKWVHDNIITEKQLNMILTKYEKNDQSYLLILFAVLLMSIGILIFIFSNWAQVPHLSRIVIMVVSMLTLYLSGHYFFTRSLTDSESEQNTHKDKPSYIYGISFIILGYVFFGATLLLILNMYNVNLMSVWPFIIWSIVGLLLYAIYKHPLLFIVGIVINVYAQLYSSNVFSSFSFITLAILMIGYFYYAFRQERALLSYFFAIGLSIHVLIATIMEVEQYYWYIFFVLLVYGLSEVVQKSALKNALAHMSLLSIFIFKIYESFLIQENYFLNKIETQSLFFIALGIIWLAIAVSKWISNRRIEMIDLILFFPLFFLPHAYFFIIISMFTVSLLWLVIGFQRQLDDKVKIGIISFIISAFTVYIQYAWETLNKSLFFLIGGILLFLLSFILERKRRSTELQKGSDLK